jgi:hypothetical protein
VRPPVREAGTDAEHAVGAPEVQGAAEQGHALAHPDQPAAAISGQEPGTLVAPLAGLVVLVLYAGAAAVAGSMATGRRDVV